MKITTWEKTTEIQISETEAEKSYFSIQQFVKALAQHSALNLQAGSGGASADFGKQIEGSLRAATHPLFSISAGADEEQGAFEFREATGEDIVKFLEANGAAPMVKYGEDGLVDEIHAMFAVGIDDQFEPCEAGEVLESLQATAPTASKIVGDLAQTTVGATGAETQVIGLSEWTLDWKRKTADATTTDNATYESSLPSTASWSVKAKYMFVSADTSQATNILATITALQSPLTWNFFPTVATGREAFSGQAYVDGITIASGMGKTVGLDVSLKGTGPLSILTQLAPTGGVGEV